MPTGIATAYDLTVGVKVNMDEAIYMYSPVDSPLILGTDADGYALIGSSPTNEIRFDWMDDVILTPRSAIAVTLVTAATEVVVTAGTQSRFSTGDLLVATREGGHDETMRVTGYSVTTADTLLLTRNWTTTGTARQYSQFEEIIGTGQALTEGSDPEAFRSTDRTERQNFTQIFGPTKIHMSETERTVAKYGVASEWDRQVARTIKENLIHREQAFVYGRKRNDTSNKRRATGGFFDWITTNVDAAATQLNVLNLVSNLTNCFNAGGVPEVLMANPNALKDLNDVENTSRVRVAPEASRRGRESVMVVSTEYGDLIVARNRWMNDDDAICFTREGVQRRVLRPVTYEPLAKTGDAEVAQIVGEEGLQVKGERHMFAMTALDYD
jgi:hypothetical protein